MRERNLASYAIALWSCLAALPAQEPAAEVDVAAAQEKLLEHLRSQGIRPDLEAKTVEIDAVVNPPMDPLEYLLIHKRGKDHEALLVTEVQPSLLNSAFLLLGFENGQNAKLEPIVPEPTEEEVAAGAPWNRVIPPEGMPIWMTVHWTEGEGEDAVEHSVCAEDLIIDLTTGVGVDGIHWVYLGGRTAKMYRNDPPVFVGDFEGNLVSVCYLSPANHLVTSVHERARDDHNWWRTDLVPETGTSVVVRFHKVKPAEVIAWEKREEKRKPYREPPGDPPTNRDRD